MFLKGCASAGWADRRVESGLGTVLDDVFAGLWGLAAMALLKLALGHGLGCADAQWWCLGLFP